MWRWIAAQKKRHPRAYAGNLKIQWLKKHKEFETIISDCFFCEYVEKRVGDCDLCPGCKIDKTFDCYNKDYNFESKPIAFYKKILQLNRIRKAKK